MYICQSTTDVTVYFLLLTLHMAERYDYDVILHLLDEGAVFCQKIDFILNIVSCLLQKLVDITIYCEMSS